MRLIKSMEFKMFLLKAVAGSILNLGMVMAVVYILNNYFQVSLTAHCTPDKECSVSIKNHQERMTP